MPLRLRVSSTLAFTAALCLGAPGESNPPAAAGNGRPQPFTFGFELRGRLERKMGLKYTPGADDTYYLHRLRIHAAIEPNRWLRFFVQGQDARAPGFSRKPTPASFANSFDLRQSYAEVGRIEGASAWGLRVGRQELRFGDARLIGLSTWSNSARAWDAVRIAVKSGSARLDCFAAALVVTADGSFDRPKLQNGFYGCYSSWAAGKSTLEPYLLWKTNAKVRGESGQFGDLDVYTAGARAVGDVTRSLSYSGEIAFQTGNYARDSVRAWASHSGINWSIPAPAWRPKVILEYNRASGDANPRDGHRGTFDQLFPSNHDKYGTADRITWRNMHNFRSGAQIAPSRDWTLTFDLHNFWVANRSDGLYTDAGALIARNPGATSSYVGPEIDLQATYQLSERLQIGFGYAHLFAGGYLRQSIKETGSTYPYIMWTYRY